MGMTSFCFSTSSGAQFLMQHTTSSFSLIPLPAATTGEQQHYETQIPPSILFSQLAEVLTKTKNYKMYKDILDSLIIEIESQMPQQKFILKFVQVGKLPSNPVSTTFTPDFHSPLIPVTTTTAATVVPSSASLPVLTIRQPISGLRVTAGFLVLSGDDVLLCHASKKSKATGSSILSDDHWGIPKGGVEKQESLLQGATRELYEETGINISQYLQQNSSIMVSVVMHPEPVFDIVTKKKHIFVFCIVDVAGVIRRQQLGCASLIKKGKKKGTPEIDCYLWKPRKEAKKQVDKKQKEIFKRKNFSNILEFMKRVVASRNEVGNATTSS